jgi:hypothetical protein
MSGRAARASRARKLVPVTVSIWVKGPDDAEWRLESLTLPYEDHREIRRWFAEQTRARREDA